LILQPVPFDHPDAVSLRSAQEMYGDELYAPDSASAHRFTS